MRSKQVRCLINNIHRERGVQGRLAGLAGGRKPWPISWVQLGALGPVQLPGSCGQARGEPLTRVQAEKPHRDLGPALCRESH